MKLLLRVFDPLEGPLRRGRRHGWRGGRYDGGRRAVWQAQLRHHPRDPQPCAYPSLDRRRLAAVELASRAQASFFYAVILDVASALREHQAYADDAPELEAKAVVVDQSHHHDFFTIFRSRAEAVSCRESGDSETITLARYVTTFRSFTGLALQR